MKTYKRNDKNYSLIDYNSLSIDFEKCGAAEQTVIAIPPKGQRTVDLEIISQKPVSPSIQFRVILSVSKVKNKEGGMLVVSNRIKIKPLKPTT